MGHGVRVKTTSKGNCRWLLLLSTMYSRTIGHYWHSFPPYKYRPVFRLVDTIYSTVFKPHPTHSSPTYLTHTYTGDPCMGSREGRDLEGCSVHLCHTFLLFPDTIRRFYMLIIATTGPNILRRYNWE